MVNNKFKTEGIYLAYDHGMEHGPKDFDEKTVSPLSIIEIAEKAEVDALVLLKGTARAYYKKGMGVPLIVKLNQKTNLRSGEPLSTQVCNVKEAIDIGASAVGYTVYAGSEYEQVMLQEFGRIEEEAHKYGLPVIMWSYPRGKAIADDEAPEIVAYAARIAMEMGADIVKLKYPNDNSKLKWIVESAGKTKVFMAGGKATTDEEFEKHVEEVISSGFSGVAVGRNVWQSNDPITRIKKIREIIKSV
jgi:class I fructose-bisphosphate aldolase